MWLDQSYFSALECRVLLLTRRLLERREFFSELLTLNYNLLLSATLEVVEATSSSVFSTLILSPTKKSKLLAWWEFKVQFKLMKVKQPIANGKTLKVENKRCEPNEHLS